MADKQVSDFSLLGAPIPPGTLILVQESGTTYAMTQAALMGALCAAVDAHIAATAAHGVSGDVVGTTDAQALSNKTFLGDQDFDGDVEMLIGKWLYFRATTGVDAEGDWRIGVSGGNFVRQVHNGTTYVTANQDTPPIPE